MTLLVFVAFLAVCLAVGVIFGRLVELSDRFDALARDYDRRKAAAHERLAAIEAELATFDDRTDSELAADLFRAAADKLSAPEPCAACPPVTPTCCVGTTGTGRRSKSVPNVSG